MVYGVTIARPPHGRPISIAGVVFDGSGAANPETLTQKQIDLLVAFGATVTGGTPTPTADDRTVAGALTVAGQVLDGSGVLRDSGEVLDALAVGQSTIPRSLCFSTLSVASGQARLAYFTSRKSETITTLGVSVVGAAGATPTLCRLGLYTVAADGTLTLVASTANAPTLFATASSWASAPLSAPYALTRGTRYAIALLVVSTATLPTFAGQGSTLSTARTAATPRLAAITGTTVTDLPATIAPASLGLSSNRLYAEATP